MRTFNDSEFHELVERHLIRLGDPRFNSDRANPFLVNATVKNVTCPKVDLRCANMTNVLFENADLSGATFAFATLNNVTFETSSLAGAVFTSVDAEFLTLDATDASGANFRNSHLESFVTRRKTKLDTADFSLAILDGMGLTETSMHSAKFAEAKMKRIHAAWVQATKANFSRADLTDARFFSCDFDESIMRFADLREAVLEKCSIRGVDFGYANVSELRLRNVDESLSPSLCDHPHFKEIDIRGKGIQLGI